MILFWGWGPLAAWGPKQLTVLPVLFTSRRLRCAQFGHIELDPYHSKGNAPPSGGNSVIHASRIKSRTRQPFTLIKQAHLWDDDCNHAKKKTASPLGRPSIPVPPIPNENPGRRCEERVSSPRYCAILLLWGSQVQSEDGRQQRHLGDIWETSQMS